MERTNSRTDGLTDGGHFYNPLPTLRKGINKQRTRKYNICNKTLFITYNVLGLWKKRFADQLI